MASTGDAPPPPPQPEELTTSAFISLITSPNIADHLTALTIIRNEPNIYIEITPYLNGLFTRSILNTPDAAIRSMAREALITLAGEVARRGDVPIIASLFSPLIRTVIASTQDLPTERDDTVNILVLLSNLASDLPPAVLPNLEAIIVANCDSEEQSRLKAINLLATLTEVAPESIPVRSLPLIVDAHMATLCKVDENIEEWMDEFSTRMSDEAVLGKDSLARVTTNLHERGIVGVILQKTREFLLYDDWTCRFAAVTALELIGTAGRIQMIDEIVHNLTFALKDPNARVGVSACKAINLMSPNFDATSTFLEDTIPPLIAAMGDTAILRLARSAAETLLTLIAYCPEIVKPSLDGLIEVMAKNFEEAAPMVEVKDSWKMLTNYQFSIVNWVANAAVQDGSRGEKFIPRDQRLFRLSTERFGSIFDRLITAIKALLANKNFLEKTVGCVARLTIVVGKEKFNAHTAFVMHTVASQLDFLTARDWFLILGNLHIICDILEENCLPFLPLLVPPLLRIGRCPPFDAESESMELLEFSSKYAMDIIYLMATALKDGFAPYVNESAKVDIHNLTVYPPTMNFDCFLASIKHEGIPAMRALWVPYWTALKEAFSRSERKQYWRFVDCIRKIIDELMPGGISIEDVCEIGVMMKTVMEKMLPGDMRKVGRGNNDGKIEFYTAEEYLHEMISRLMDSLCKADSSFINIVHSLFPVVITTMSSTNWAAVIVKEHNHHAPMTVAAPTHGL